jgi:leader peptidase (prepilin peptidase)/N-methyltransferase
MTWGEFLNFTPLMMTFGFFFGLIVGSFLNVCIYRLPREDMSIIRPVNSLCFNCKTHIMWYDNIPVLSYIILKGKCRHCGTPFSVQYPIVEFLTGLIFSLIIWRFGASLESIGFFVFASMLIIISFIDLELFIIPNEISFSGIIFGTAWAAVVPFLPARVYLIEQARPFGESNGWWAALANSLIGTLAGGGVLLFIGVAGYYVFKKEAMGGGDIKLLAMVGAFLGIVNVIITLFIGSILGTIIGGTLLLMNPDRKKEEGDAENTEQARDEDGELDVEKEIEKGHHYIPFGPFLALAALISMFIGLDIWEWYSGFFVISY